MNFKLSLNKYLYASFYYYLFFGGCHESELTDSEREHLIISNEQTQMQAVYPDLPVNDLGVISEVNFIQTIQIIDSLGIKKVRMGILAACLNFNIDTRDKIYGGELYFNGINIPFNNQNFYSKWYEDTLSIDNLLQDSIHLELKGSGMISPSNEYILQPFPSPYVIKELPSIIIKENKYNFDSTIYFSGVNKDSKVGIYKDGYINQSGTFQSVSYDPTDKYNVILLKPGFCFVTGFICDYQNNSPMIRIIEYKK